MYSRSSTAFSLSQLRKPRLHHRKAHTFPPRGKNSRQRAAPSCECDTRTCMSSDTRAVLSAACIWSSGHMQRTRTGAMNLVWSPVLYNEGLFMAGNPFEEVLRAPLTLALLADRQSGQKNPLCTSLQPSCRYLKQRGTGRHETVQREHLVTMCHSPWQPQGAHWFFPHCLVGRAGSKPCFCRQAVG